MLQIGLFWYLICDRDGMGARVNLYSLINVGPRHFGHHRDKITTWPYNEVNEHEVSVKCWCQSVWEREVGA